jgi:hypothetical protein
VTGPYAAHDALVAPARRRAAVWRLALGALLVVAVYVAIIAAVAAFVQLRYGTFLAGGFLLAMTTGNTPGGLLMLLYSFGGLAIGCCVAVRLLHDRRAGTLFGPARATLQNACVVALPLIALNLLALPLVLGREGIEPGLAPRDFAVMLVPALVGLAVQIGAEELAFRGYLQQQLAARFRAPLVWAALPSVLFGALHYSPQDFGAAAPVVAIWAGLFGLAAADLTARTGNLGAALGLHFATNVAALLFVSLAGTLDGLALWRIRVDFSNLAVVPGLMAVDFLMILIGWLVARLLLRR